MRDCALLRSGDLYARVLYPESPRYTRARFCHAAFLSDVGYAGKRYTRYERGFNTTEGSGLCCEYDCSSMERDTPVGRRYLKFGVGTFTRREEPWRITDRNAYDPLPIEAEMRSDRAAFFTRSPSVGGYAYEETRAVTLDGNEITLRVTLQNVGEKPFSLVEYAHNFCSLGDRDVGPDYGLRVPALAHPETMACPGVLEGETGGFRYISVPQKPYFMRSEDTQACDTAWEMWLNDGSARVREKVSFKPARVALWGSYYVASVEIFHAVDLAAGETDVWTRNWRFA